MCGILFSLTTAQQQVDPELWQTLTEINTKRGPDSQQTRTISVGDHFLQFYSTVLHLRGRDNVPQPVCENGNILCWNGEIFDGLSIALGENDTAALMQHLTRVDTKNSTAFLKVISRIEGPFAFVFWQEESKRLWFGRDCLGRRSLLWSRNENSLVISSAAQPNDKVEWQEVPANGIYSVQLGKEDEPETLKPVFTINQSPVLLYPWLQQEENPRLALPFPRLNRGIPALGTETIDSNNELPPPDETMQTAVRDFTNVLDDAVKRRVADIPFIDSVHSRPRVAVLFSGGLDCICLAALAHRHLPVSEPIDLLNVAFENPRSQNAKQQKKASGDGGTTNTATATVYNTPDRVTGRASVEELRKIAPERTWHFVEINVPYSEAMTYREHIINLMHPLDTVMDLSIAMALWFASRGKGTIDIDGAYEPYESHARVLISGLGADEQLGGYSRHREAFRHGGWERLISESQLDVDRISFRNLGRDDRIISDHGKEARFPYLSTSVVNHLCRLPIDIKMDMRYGRGIGEKLLLRQVGHCLGLVNACRNWKRAIQFGAKTAKMTGETRAEKGQHRLTTK